MPLPVPRPLRVHWALLVITAVALLVAAFRFHPIGDYFTESDFYGGYAAGARALAHGSLDWSRYGVYGPLYEVVLAVVGAITGDFFVAARLISVASAVTVVAAVGWLANRRWNAAAASWMVLLVASNPVFFRYGYSATTDMLGGALWTLAAAALLASDRPRTLVAAGIAAALATLTRYNLLSVVPAGLVLVMAARTPISRRLRSAAIFAGAFMVVLAPCGITAVAAGHPLGVTLIQDAGFYLDDSPHLTLESRFRTLDRGVSSDTAEAIAPARLLARLISGAPSHLELDAGSLLGWPVAISSAVALLGLAAARRARGLLALLPPWGFTFLALAPIFYSERYSLVLVPAYVAPAALGLTTALESSRLRTAVTLTGLLVVMLSLRSSFALQRAVAASIPREALAAGDALRHAARPGEAVIARKGHVAFTAGLTPVLFPDLDSLSSLSRFAQRTGAHYLYYSWYELRLRPRFGFLLDTSAAVPGLTPLHATVDKPSATYAIGEGFGATPSWWSDASRRSRIAERVNELMSPDHR